MKNTKKPAISLGILLIAVLGAVGVYSLVRDKVPAPTQTQIDNALEIGMPKDTVNTLVRNRCLSSLLNAIQYGEHTDYWCSQNYRNLDRYMENKNDY